MKGLGLSSNSDKAQVLAIGSGIQRIAKGAKSRLFAAPEWSLSRSIQHLLAQGKLSEFGI